MTEVNVRPMPDWQRKISPRLWPSVSPLFQKVGKGGVGEKDRMLARELFSLLDTVSQSWYLRACPGLFSEPLEKERIQGVTKITSGKIAEGSKGKLSVKDNVPPIGGAFK